MKPIILILIPFILACMTAPALATVTPTLAPVTVTMVPRVNTSAIEIDACKLTAVTDTNLRVCGGMGCDIIGEIAEGEAVEAVCTAGNQWALLPGRGYFCVSALIGTGGCE